MRRQGNAGKEPYFGTMRRCLCIVLLVLLCLQTQGCAPLQSASGGDGGEGLRIVFTTGFGKDELFRVDRLIGTKQEMLLYLVNAANRYEQSLGEGILSYEADGMLVGDAVRESCLKQAAQIKAMNLLAEKNGIRAEKAELALADEAAKTYFASLTQEDLDVLDGVTEETVARLYREFVVADKLYRYAIRDINPEVSDDEARTITLAQICVFKGEDPEAARAKITEARTRLGRGESFETLCGEYNEAEEERISFGKGEKEPAIETGAFALAAGEISSVIEGEGAFYLFKCVSSFDKVETLRNKEKIIEERQREAFSRQYDAFAGTLPVELNEALWQTLRIPSGSGSTTTGFTDFFER